MLQTFAIQNWHEDISYEIKKEALHALESGKVIFLPNLGFNLLPHERVFLSAKYASSTAKNISYDLNKQELKGAVCDDAEYMQLTQMLHRYAQDTKLFLKNLFPHYEKTLIHSRTSYRPVEICGRRPASFRKDDTRLHVDAFPSQPTQGKRILRIFSHVDPEGKPRIWRLGAPFQKVLEYFHPKLKKPIFGSATLLHILKITKNKRTEYDHYMLQLHNAMKADKDYQEQVPQLEFRFPAGSSWIVYTDQVSHAAMQGQFTFEQTSHLPTYALAQENTSPLKMLERFLHRRLV